MNDLLVGTAVTLVAAAAVGIIVLNQTRTPDPIYNGKPLSAWLDHHVPSSGASPPYGSAGWKKAHEAIRAIGSDGVPTLVQMLAAEDQPSWLRKGLDSARLVGLPLARPRNALELHEEAEYAFEILGKEAQSAVPDLIQIYQQDISSSSQRCTASALGHIGVAASKALPVLIRNFSHSDSQVRFDAVSAVMQIKGPPVIVVPALTKALNDSNVNVRWNALVGLSRYGRQAQSAVPKILQMYSDDGKVGDSPITEQVETTIWRIAPEKIPERFVVENRSPIVHEGQTTQALKLLYNGERKTWIAPDKSVPTGGQYWNSDPRPYLSLYRGEPHSTQNDVFLGNFEIVNIPDLAEGENQNISTLCIIAESTIYLCARENHSNTFLIIRRLNPDNKN